MNKITKEITPQILANEVRMMRSGLKATVIFLVEGDSDAIFFRRLLCVKKEQIVITYGKPNALKTIEILDTDNQIQGYLALLDTDLDKITGNLPTSPNIALTDTHDVETLIASSADFNEIIKELCGEEKLREFEELEGVPAAIAIARRALDKSLLRLVATQLGIPLTFKDEDHRHFNIKEYTSDRVTVVRKVLAVSGRLEEVPGFGHPNEELLLDKISIEEKQNHDLWHLCNGKDFVLSLSIALRRKLANRTKQNSEPKEIQSILRLSYQRDTFLKTKMNAAIMDWARCNSGYALHLP